MEEANSGHRTIPQTEVYAPHLSEVEQNNFHAVLEQLSDFVEIVSSEGLRYSNPLQGFDSSEIIIWERGYYRYFDECTLDV
jgi:hypothetical protein